MASNTANCPTISGFLLQKRPIVEITDPDYCERMPVRITVTCGNKTLIFVVPETEALDLIETMNMLVHTARYHPTMVSLTASKFQVVTKKEWTPMEFSQNSKENMS